MLAPLAVGGASAFVAPQQQNHHLPARAKTFRQQLSAIASVDEDCGCGGAIVSGAPSAAAQAMNPRVAISQSTFSTLDGVETNMNNLIGGTGTSLVVFLRSLG